MKRTRHPLRTPLVALVILALATAGAHADVPGTATMDDGQFLDQLSPGASGPIGTPELDRRRMAKLLFSLGATLGSGKANVRMLQGAMHMRGASATSGRGIVAESYTGYDLTVERFRVQVSAFLDRPDSDPLLFETLSDGHEVCWRLDAYTRLVESYGVSVQIMVSILASREACNQFRRAAFSRPVQRTIVSALEDAEQQTEQLQDLRDEIASLEQLVEDLREIEER